MDGSNRDKPQIGDSGNDTKGQYNDFSIAHLLSNIITKKTASLLAE